MPRLNAAAVHLTLSLLLFLFVSQRATSATPGVTILVNSTADMLAPSDGACTLREAILNANADLDTTGGDCAPGDGEDTVVLPAGRYVLEIAGPGEDAGLAGDIDITEDVTLRGVDPGSTIIDAAGLDRVLDVLDGADVAIEGVTVTGGSSGTGGGISNLGGSLELSHSRIVDNAGFAGAGVFSHGGSVLILRTTISGNDADTFGGIGGGIYNADSYLEIVESTLMWNTADDGTSGGGIYNDYGGSLVLVDSTIAYNDEAGIENFGSALIANSTISENDSIGLDALADFRHNAGSATLLNSTVGIYRRVFPFFSDAAETTATNTIFIGGCIDEDGDDAEFIDGGHNIAGTWVDPWTGEPQPGFGGCLDQPTSLLDTDPLVAPLDDNGGPTLTHALLAGSPAIDVGDNVACPLSDQRGAPRPQDGNEPPDGTADCDIGAVEVGVLPEPSALLQLGVGFTYLLGLRRGRVRAA